MIISSKKEGTASYYYLHQNQYIYCTLMYTRPVVKQPSNYLFFSATLGSGYCSCPHLQVRKTEIQKG